MTRVDAHRAVRATHQPRGGTAEKPVRALETIRPRHEHMIARTKAGGGVRLDHFARGLIAGHQRIAHPRKGGHLPGPEEFFRAGRNSGMGNLHHDIACARRLERQPVDDQILRTLQADCAGFHDGPLLGGICAGLTQRGGSFPNVILKGQACVSIFVYT
jgi:hypothetical protein